MTETADGEMRSVNREGRNDDVDTRSVRKAGVHHWRGLIHTPSDCRNNLVNDVHQVRVILEHNVAFLKESSALYIHLLGAVDQDVINGWIL